jgi:quercetin dioxygenase-like cupin family protein
MRLMSLLSQPLNAGKLTGTVYTFENKGDMLPMHTHDEDTAHITVVARGLIRAHGNGWSADYGAGSVIDFPSNQSHEFIALEDNSRIVNIQK